MGEVVVRCLMFADDVVMVASTASIVGGGGSTSTLVRIRHL